MFDINETVLTAKDATFVIHALQRAVGDAWPLQELQVFVTSVFFDMVKDTDNSFKRLSISHRCPIHRWQDNLSKKKLVIFNNSVLTNLL